MSTYIARNGCILRDPHVAGREWHAVDPEVAQKLLAALRQDATDTADWFHRRAAQLADELEQAMREAGLIEEEAA